MENLKFINRSFKSESFSGMQLSKFTSIQSEFINCEFKDMDIKNACFGSGDKASLYIDCSFDNSVFSSLAPGRARFEKCSFKNVKIKKLFCVNVEMVDCVISGEIKQGNFLGIYKDIDGSVSVNEFKNNDFSNLELGDFGFVNIDLKSQKLPKQSYFVIIDDVRAFLVRAKEKISKIKDDSQKELALRVLNIIELESEGGNNQMFVDKRSFPKNLQDIVSMIFNLS